MSDDICYRSFLCDSMKMDNLQERNLTFLSFFAPQRLHAKHKKTSEKKITAIISTNGLKFGGKSFCIFSFHHGFYCDDIVHAFMKVKENYILTYYVVGHFHYVLSMGAVFGMFAGFYYWIGKITGLQYPETLGQIHFWTFFLGVNITFFPMHFLGLAGMPRRIPDYPDAFADWNAIASYGSYLSIISSLFFFYVVYKTLTGNEVCPNNPWVFDGEPNSATTLEWMLPSPPGFHTFEEIPAIKELDSAALKLSSKTSK